MKKIPMTDTQAPERNTPTTTKEVVEKYAELLDTGDLMAAQPFCANLLRALVAERNQLKRLLKEAIEWNWIDFEGEEHKETYPRLSKLSSEIQTALEKE